MKKPYKLFITASLSVIAFVGCGNENDAPDAGRGNSPDFTGTIEGTSTRAFDTSWDPDDKIGITVTDGSVIGGNITGGGASNLLHTHQGNGKFTVSDPTKQIVFADDKQVEFTAYYPYYSNLPANGIINKSYTSSSSNLTTSQQANQKNFDFLWAKAYGSKGFPDVKLKFSHVMSKISFVFKSGEDMDVSEISSYTLAGFCVTGQFDTKTGICSTTRNTTSSITVNVTGAEDGKPVTPCIVFPQVLQAIPVQLGVRGSGSSFVYLTCQLPFKDTNIEAGNEYRFIITVNKTRMTVNEAIISGWEDMDLGDNWEAL